MANLIWFLIFMALFMGSWYIADEAGSMTAFVFGIACGIAAFTRILALGGII